MKRDWLKEIRKEKNMTQIEVAKAVGIAKSSYSLIENGERNPSGKVAIQIAQLLEFDMSLFFCSVGR